MTRKTAGKWVEILFPWVVASAAALSVHFVNYPDFFISGSKPKLLDKMVDICAIGIGFWTTAATLLLALEDRSTVRGLKELGTYSRIVGYFLWTIYSLLALLALSMLSIGMGRPDWVPHEIFWASWAFLLAFSGSSMLRAFWLLGKLLKAR
jgi:hypothetical protein